MRTLYFSAKPEKVNGELRVKRTSRFFNNPDDANRAKLSSEVLVVINDGNMNLFPQMYASPSRSFVILG